MVDQKPTQTKDKTCDRKYPVASSKMSRRSARIAKSKEDALTHSKISTQVEVSSAVLDNFADLALETQARVGSVVTVPAASPANITLLSQKLTKTITKLNSSDHKTLVKKQDWLKNYQVPVPKYTAKVNPALAATLVFAQEEAGTAVCISKTGLILTCSHCVAETKEDFDETKFHWLIFASGLVVQTQCVAWDPKRDLALLQIRASQNEKISESEDTSSLDAFTFPFISPASTSPSLNARLACIGHPGAEDLEALVPGIKTNYDVLHVSTGAFHGYAIGQDLQDNSEIGALMHDCWTYWGHSGAPIIDGTTGKLIGLHSSWDDETGMRRGVALEAILEFLKNHSELIS